MTAPLLNEMKFYVVIPAAATNYVTNPTPYRATTGYTALTGSIAQSAISGRRGPRCIKVTPTTAESGLYFSTISVTDTQDYTFSVDVKGESGKAMRIQVEDAGATYTHETTFTATGYWQRIEVTLTAEETAADYRLYVLRDATTGTTDFWVDGFQFEDDEVTTFFSGNSKGFGIAPLEFYWGGTPHGSVSYRTADTRAGGSLLNLEDYAIVSKAFGLGEGNFEQIYTNLVSGGAYYQKHIRRPRNFSLLLDYYGANAGELHDNRNAVIEAIRPDYTGYDQPLVIRYQGENTDGYEATNPVDIICIPQPSHADLPDNSRLQMNEPLNFTVLDSYLNGAYQEGLELGLYDTLAVLDFIAYRDMGGLWNNICNGATGVGAATYLYEGKDGTIYIGGNFTNAGGVAEADYLCKWTGTAIEAVTAAANFDDNIYAISEDAEGNLYIGGDFLNAGDADGDGIVKWDGSALSSLGTGCADNGVLAIAVEPDTGDVYVAGDFTGMGGVADTSRIAYYDISASVWKPLSTGLGSSVYALVFAANGDLYIGGAFTNADGANGDYVCYWDGSAFNMLGDDELSAAVNTLAFDKEGILYAGGLFTNAGDDANADYIAKFMNNRWESLSSERIDNEVRSIFITKDNEIYLSGAFTEASSGLSNISDSLIAFHNGAWFPVDVNPGGSGQVYQAIIDKNGYFYYCTGSNAATVACDQKTVTNEGNTAVYPTFEILGPGVLQSITNYTTGKAISFDGLTLQAGERITIKTDPVNVPDKERITSDWAGRGLMGKYINPGSDMGQFSLKPGDNYINLFMPSGTDANTEAFIYWTPKFWNLEGSRL